MKVTKQHIIDIMQYHQVSTWFVFAGIMSALYLTIVPVETCFSKSEVLMCSVIPIVALIGGAISILTRHHLRFTAIDCIILIWYIYIMGLFWMEDTYPASSFAIKSTLVFLLYVSMRLLMSSGKSIERILVISLVLFSLIEAFIGYSQLLSDKSRHHLYPVTGSFLNPGPYSAYLAMGLVLLLSLKKRLILRHQSFLEIVTFFERQRKFRIIHIKNYNKLAENVFDAFLLIIAVPLVLTVSRAAFIAVVVCILILYRYRISGWKQWLMIGVIMTAIGVLLYIFKSGSADGRGIINFIGAKCIAGKPWFGNGIGSFFYIYAEETARLCQNGMIDGLMKVDVIDYSFNDLLLVGMEQGLVGLLIAIALICIVLIRLWDGNRSLFLGSLTLLIISLFSYPFALLPYQIIAVIMTAYASGISPKVSSVSPCDNKKDTIYGLKNSIKIILTILVIFLISNVLLDTIQMTRKAEREYNMMSGIRDAAFIKDYYKLLPQLEGNKRFLFDFGVMLAKAGRYNDSNDMLRRGALISNDPMFLILQGNNFRDMEAYRMAEESYLKAWHTMPNRIYPLYQLMKLYQTEGNKKKVAEYAEKVICFKEKISSPAVNDMKREAHEIINFNVNYTIQSEETDIKN